MVEELHQHVMCVRMCVYASVSTYNIYYYIITILLFIFVGNLLHNTLSASRAQCERHDHVLSTVDPVDRCGRLECEKQ